MSGQLDELMTPIEVAAALRVPIGTLRQWRHRSSGPRSFRVGQAVRYRRSDVGAYLKRQEAGTARGGNEPSSPAA